jgi:hypothetical protein
MYYVTLPCVAFWAIGTGLVDSLPRPGGNVTEMSMMALEVGRGIKGSLGR